MNAHTLTRSHTHTLTRSHAHTLTRSHTHTLTRSHAHTRYTPTTPVLAQFIKNSSRQLRSARKARILVQLNTSENSPILYERSHTHTPLTLLTPLTPLTPLNMLTPLTPLSVCVARLLRLSCLSRLSPAYVSSVLCCASISCVCLVCVMPFDLVCLSNASALLVFCVARLSNASVSYVSSALLVSCVARLSNASVSYVSSVLYRSTQCVSVARLSRMSRLCYAVRPNASI